MLLDQCLSLSRCQLDGRVLSQLVGGVAVEELSTVLDLILVIVSVVAHDFGSKDASTAMWRMNSCSVPPDMTGQLIPTRSIT